jgi:hypothetical protein
MKVAHVELIRASDEKKKLLEAEREILQRSLGDSSAFESTFPNRMKFNDPSESESPSSNRMKLMPVVVSPAAAAS